MKVVHVVNVNPGRFVLPFAQRMNQLGFEDQTFLPIGTQDKQAAFCQEIENSRMIPYPQTHHPVKALKFLVAFGKELESYDLVIWHSLFFQRILLSFLLFFHPEVVKKSAWLVWGGDLYAWQGRSRVLNRLYQTFVSRLKAGIVLFPPDEKELRKLFDFKQPVFTVNYSNHIHMLEVLDRTQATAKEKDSPLRILIGHSATPAMHHKRCLDLLSRFRSENILICLPLSYGSPEYADEVEAYAKELFGPEKVLSLRDYMPVNSYMEFLRNIDAAIFDSERQIALGNIYPLMYMKTPLYLTRDGVMYQYFTELNLSVGAVDELAQINTPADMCYAVSEDNHAVAKRYYDIESFRQVWQAVFDALQP